MHQILSNFHPLVSQWFTETLGEPTEPQIAGWPKIQNKENVLIVAPTGSGKTLSAFLACLNELFLEAANGTLKSETKILYVSPLKALGNDIEKNLLLPLEQMKTLAEKHNVNWPNITVKVRTGDTSPSERAAMIKNPPHILITTPESLYLYLTSERSRKTLESIRTVVVDEIHALARDKRGSHFALSLERLKHVSKEKVQLIGLSATTRPLEKLAHFLTGNKSDTCQLVHIGHSRPYELTVETPEDELSSAATHEMWGQIYERLIQLSSQNRTMLIFSNTRRLAERLAHDLGERMGHDVVTAHHGSMSREARLAAENRLKSGTLKVMVATASLELGLDIGSIDLVVQMGSPRSIAVMLQRLGRAGHHKAAISKGIMFALTRDELVECVALTKSIAEKELDIVRIPEKPLDVLAQQIVAEVAAAEWHEEALYKLFCQSMPYEKLTVDEFESVLNLVSEGVSTSRGRSRVHIHRDRVNKILRPRKGARLMAVQNGGAIPDLFSYAVVAEPDGKKVGTLDEDFAIDSMAGQVFVLGSTSWRIRRIHQGEVRVENAHGQPPSIPFWNGEAPARTDELSLAVANLREWVMTDQTAKQQMETRFNLSPILTDFLVRYIQAGHAALGATPTQKKIVAERFFDEAGGMQLIIHSPFGARINRAWGLALRKSFCRSFDFELQAAASDDGVLLSLSEQHSFPLMDIFDFVSPNVAHKTLTQAVLQAPMFGTRFRWAAGRALTLSRLQNGKKVPPPIQRARAEDLIAAVFPEQVGCQDNHGGMEIEPPDHPLVNETMKDCMSDLMDIDGLIELLKKLKSGEIEKVAMDVPEPSVFAHQMLNSAPYTFLDDAPLEERRARTVAMRRTLPAADAVHFGALDDSAIAQVIDEAQPAIRDIEEFHDLLLTFCVLPVGLFDIPQLEMWTAELESQKRVAQVNVNNIHFIIPAERVQVARALFPDASIPLNPLAGDEPVERETAARNVVRPWMEVCGPTTTPEVLERLHLSQFDVDSALAKLEASGQVLRGQFRSGVTEPASVRERVKTAAHDAMAMSEDALPVGLASRSEPKQIEWCDRRLLQRIHRLTLGRLRKEIEPLSHKDFMRFLFRWHHMDEAKLRGPMGVAKAVSLLQGYEAPASSWETELLPARMKQYVGEWLEAACFSGDVAYGRLSLKESKIAAPIPVRRGLPVEKPIIVPPGKSRKSGASRSGSLTFVKRTEMDWMLSQARPNFILSDGRKEWPTDLSQPALDIVSALERRGASFFNELVSSTRRLPTEIEDALWELLARGFVTADAVQNIRVLMNQKMKRNRRALQRGGPGRWSLLLPHETVDAEAALEKLAMLYLNRYGIVFRDILARETLAPPWRELAQIYRRLEARGEIRGGRFIADLAGEQFALPDAIETSRSVRRQVTTGSIVYVAGVDPLNLTGIIGTGPRVPAHVGQVVVYVDGVPQEKPHEQVVTD
jgi:ATP-dependent helicase Lhr and Lhr-like helicase